MKEYQVIVNGVTVILTPDETEAQVILGQIVFHNEFATFDCDKSGECVIWRVSMDLDRAMAA